MVSIPFWIGMTAPIFGYFADQFGKRIFCLAGAISMGITTILLLLILPESSSIGIIYVCLIIFGLFIGSLCAYVLPCYPLICERKYVGTAFGIGYGLKNLGLSLFSFLGSISLGSNEDQFVTFFMFYLIIFSISMGLQFLVYLIDKKKGGNLNSSKPEIPEDTHELIERLKSFG